jgi:hypothetical protein
MGATGNWFSLERFGTALGRLMTRVRELPFSLGRRATDARPDVQARQRLVVQLEEQAARTADSVLELLHLASRKDVSRLDARIAELEQRLEALSQGAR